jgi:hypothetical protein
MLSINTKLGFNRVVSIWSRSSLASKASFKSIEPKQSSPTLKLVSRSYCSSKPHNPYTKQVTNTSKRRKLANDVVKQIKEDTKRTTSSAPETGPNSGSARSRRQESKSVRYPEYFLTEVQQVEVESEAHLNSIKKHFVETLGTFVILPGQSFNAILPFVVFHLLTIVLTLIFWSYLPF